MTFNLTIKQNEMGHPKALEKICSDFPWISECTLRNFSIYGQE